jgi:hypothetical protein
MGVSRSAEGFSSTASYALDMKPTRKSNSFDIPPLSSKVSHQLVALRRLACPVQSFEYDERASVVI